MKVTVTVADAEKAWEFYGDDNRSQSCPLAQALQREVGRYAFVAGTVAMCGTPHRLTHEATMFVHLADETGDDPIALGLPREIEVWAD